MPLTEYVDEINDDGNEVRVRIRTERGHVVDFVVQYEIVFETDRYAVVRYDGSHGRAHRDTLDAQGETIRKVWLSEYVTFDQAIRDARLDFDDNWSRSRDEFLRRMT